MDSSAGPILLLAPIVIVIVAYLLAWRGKSLKVRKFANLALAVVVGLVALFGSWWALGMTIGIWGLDGSGMRPHTVGDILLALVLEILLCIFPAGLWYFCSRFVKAVLRTDQAAFRDP